MSHSDESWYEYVYSESIYTTLMSHSDGDESYEYVYSESIEIVIFVNIQSLVTSPTNGHHTGLSNRSN